MAMESKTNGEVQDWPAPPSPIAVLQQISEGAIKVAGQAWNNAYPGSPIMNTPNLESGGPRHRRTRSEVVTSFNRRSSSSSNFQRWKSHMQRALQWGSRSFREDSQSSSFDPEILANQKRQWYQRYSKALDPGKYEEPTSIFEHFVIVGLHPDANLEVVEDAYIRNKKLEHEITSNARPDFGMRQYRRHTIPTIEPQVLFKYPHGNKLALPLKDLAAFCFPGGVKARVLERTPSLSELNEVVYGQEHLCRDDLSFVFSLKVADNATLYGICLHIEEVVQRPPVGISSPLSRGHSRSSRFLVSAPRCYCILTKMPFFNLHFEMLNSIVAQERLNRITQFVSQITLAEQSPLLSTCTSHINKNIDSPNAKNSADWMSSAIPVDSAMALTAAAAGIISDEELPSTRWEFCSPESATASEASDLSQTRDFDKSSGKCAHFFDDCASESSENPSNNGHQSPESGQRNQSLERIQSFGSLFGSARSVASEEYDDIFCNHDEDPGDGLMMEWPKENKNELLQIVCGYHSIKVPTRGSEIIFEPLEHLQAIEYRRPPVSSLGVSDRYLELADYGQTRQDKLKLSAAEEAVSLSLWSTATICRVLSLDSILALVTGVLLEKQVVVYCPNLGVVSAVVLSLIPLIRPFEWQSLFLPVLPGKMLEFLDAPVPFIVGIQHKPADLKMKTSLLVQVNVLKDQVKSCSLPQLPQRRELMSELKPIHYVLSCEASVAQRHPVYKCSELQAEAAAQFLDIMRRYMESLCSDLRLHTITNVQSNNDRVSILLKDSFVDSFPVRDQSFVKVLVDTQLFTVLSDYRLSSYENE